MLPLCQRQNKNCIKSISTSISLAISNNFVAPFDQKSSHNKNKLSDSHQHQMYTLFQQNKLSDSHQHQMYTLFQQNKLSDSHQQNIHVHTFPTKQIVRQPPTKHQMYTAALVATINSHIHTYTEKDLSPNSKIHVHNGKLLS